ncbi:hypothetical protein [Sphingobium sp. CFD-1]|uniref:hypothetical protein n=1 Tax=Sphingobium sp. CFD-1 TaxID=2878545 RepID=UPI00214B1BD8|nr:hypothetical protein [Sphingobium sp. CFD-1]
MPKGKIITRLLPFSEFKLFGSLLSATSKLEKSVNKQRAIHAQINKLFQENFDGVPPDVHAKNIQKIRELNEELKSINQQ